ncbi:MAG TPA: EAL domain-containing protein [Usitatibacter sp.]|nr:EAL domain-containing protein [Usitatibacter sp.]
MTNALLKRWIAQTLVAAGAIALSAMLLATISLTTFDPRWAVFLSGVLCAAVLSLVSRSANARWKIARKTAQLNATRTKLAAEIRLRAHAEEALQRLRSGVELVDESLPAMIIYLDKEQRVRYHNRSFKRLLGVESSAIDGRRLEDLVGAPAFLELREPLSAAGAGREIRFEWMMRPAGQKACRLDVQCQPDFADDGAVRGIFAILCDATCADDLAAAPQPVDVDPAPLDMAEKLASALEHDEFSLYWQGIASLRADATPRFHEVLLRMNEEEEKQIPPGTFLPWAEQLGLMPDIDRWVVRHVVEFAAGAQPDAVFMVNLSPTTIRDPGFADFVRECLQSHGVAGDALGFELVESDLLAHCEPYQAFIDSLRGSGCRIAVSGFGNTPLSLRRMHNMGVDILKLDGGLVLAVERSPADLSRLKAINRAAHAAGMKTIAECVENDITRALLERIDTDYAQGFGIARPRPMSATDLDSGSREANAAAA